MRWIQTLALMGCSVTVACGGTTEPADAETDSESATDSSGVTPSGSGPVDPGDGDTTGVATGQAEADSGTSADVTTDPGGDTTTAGEDESTGDPPPAEGCQPDPSRLVVLGDSIAACAGVGGTSSDDCAPRLLHDHLAAGFGEVTYENLSVGGAVTTDVSDSQIFNIEVGMPGHVVVMIYIGGNDLAQYIFLPDDAATNGWNNTTGPEVAAAWEDILDFLGDETNFPDGVTLLMNTQYNPFDDCTAPPYFVSQTKIELLHAHNDALTARADSRPWAFIADQHPSYLGHGHYVNDAGCPYYDETYEGWMNDLIHPNEAGHHHLAEVLTELTDVEVYGGCE